MRFNVTRALKSILDSDEPLYLRAASLFELQVALLSCKGVSKRSSDEKLIVIVDKKLVCSARILAQLRLLENKRMQTQVEGAVLRTMSFISDPDVFSTVDDLLFGRYELQRIRYALHPKKFDEQVRKARKRAYTVAGLTDFSLRFEKSDLRPRLKGGITSALKLFNDDACCKEFELHGRRYKTTETAEKKLRPVCGLLWLGLRHSNVLKPLKLCSPDFSDKLLFAVQDVSSLERLVRSHEFVRHRLSQRKYECKHIGLPGDEKIELVSIPDDIILRVPKA